MASAPHDNTTAEAPETPRAADTPKVKSPEALIARIEVPAQEVAESSDHCHLGAQQREGLIDHLQIQLEILRRGEGRDLLQLLLAGTCRPGDALVPQAAKFSQNFGAERAPLRLRSYAQAIHLTLASNGAVSYTLDDGDRFERVMTVGSPTRRPPKTTPAGPITRMQHNDYDYMDIEANTRSDPRKSLCSICIAGESND